MVDDSYMDILNNVGESKFAAKRCVQCGEVVDPVILRNRATSHEANDGSSGKGAQYLNCVSLND
jgi:hypothetical protein